MEKPLRLTSGSQMTKLSIGWHLRGVGLLSHTCGDMIRTSFFGSPIFYELVPSSSWLRLVTSLYMRIDVYLSSVYSWLFSDQVSCVGPVTGVILSRLCSHHDPPRVQFRYPTSPLGSRLSKSRVKVKSCLRPNFDKCAISGSLQERTSPINTQTMSCIQKKALDKDCFNCI